MPDIIITEFMDEAAIDDLRRDYDVVYDPGLADHPQALNDLLHGAHALIVRNRTQVRETLLAAAPVLRVVGRLGVGLDNIDLEACAARDVEVCPATGANDAAVAEYVITAAMILLRGAWRAHDDMLAGRWPRQDCMGAELGGKRLGLIGLGGIARQVSRRAAAFDMCVTGCDPFVDVADSVWESVERQTFETLVGDSDIISLHVPLTDDTRRLIDAAAITRMKAGAVFINSARGGIVDEDALVEALRTGHVGGAALDVFENEPLGKDTARMFAGLPNLILTPHIAGITHESNTRVSAVTAANVRRVLESAST